ncbi:terminase small subunit [Alcaligenes aquatilis]|uniref:terminase small subunit n=1 Tax=Alcaligenes aquatilis TaxID=323284 RepID=UPI003D1FD8A8
MTLTPKQEAFALAYVETGNASEAYRRSYNAERMKPEVIAVKASELLAHGKVSVRIKELQAAHADRHKLTVDDLLRELEEARQAALTAETAQSSAAVAATMGKAKLLGMDKQVIEHSGPGGGPIPVKSERDMSDSELLAIINGARGKG